MAKVLPPLIPPATRPLGTELSQVLQEYAFRPAPACPGFILRKNVAKGTRPNAQPLGMGTLREVRPSGENRTSVVDAGPALWTLRRGLSGETEWPRV